MNAPLPLDGKVALVTGAARGLGAGIGLALARAGARVALTDIDRSELDETGQELTGEGFDPFLFTADVSQFDDMADVVSRIVDRCGRLDLIVANAAVLQLIPIDQLDARAWRRVLAVNLDGVFHTFRAGWAALRASGGGHCIAIASGSSVRGFEGEVAYCAAKHGIEGMTKALALEGEEFNIAVNTVGPGKLIKPTNLTRAEATRVSQEERARWADPAELGRAFVWLAAQPPSRFSGLRFDAGPIVDTLDREGPEFAFAPKKVTLYPHEMEHRLEHR